MKFATATQVKARFEAYLKQSESAPLIVTKRGKPVAMLVAVTAESVTKRGVRCSDFCFGPAIYP